MSLYPQQPGTEPATATREDFADGSALVTYPDGSMIIIESALAKTGALCEGRPAKYNEPPPAPPAASRSAPGKSGTT